MPGYSYYPTKRAAVEAVKRDGYTVHFDTGQSGDYAYGSRLYFSKPGAKVNEHGFPYVHAVVSKLGVSKWGVAEFGEE